MSGLIIPRWLQEQPTNTVRIARNNPLSYALEVGYHFGLSGTLVYDASGKYKATATAPAYETGRFGRSWKGARGSFATSQSNYPAAGANRPLTIAAWVKPQVSDTGIDCILSLGDPNAGSGARAVLYVNVIANGDIYFDCTNVAVRTGGGVIVAGAWHHVALVYDGTGTVSAPTCKIYLNGASQVIVRSGPVDTGINLPAAPVRIAEDATGSSRQFRGSIGPLNVWSRALGVADIIAHRDAPWQIYVAPGRRLWIAATNTVNNLYINSTESNLDSVAISSSNGVSGSLSATAGLDSVAVVTTLDLNASLSSGAAIDECALSATNLVAVAIAFSENESDAFVLSASNLTNLSFAISDSLDNFQSFALIDVSANLIVGENLDSFVASSNSSLVANIVVSDNVDGLSIAATSSIAASLNTSAGLDTIYIYIGNVNNVSISSVESAIDTVALSISSKIQSTLNISESLDSFTANSSQIYAANVNVSENADSIQIAGYALLTSLIEVAENQKDQFLASEQIYVGANLSVTARLDTVSILCYAETADIFDLGPSGHSALRTYVVAKENRQYVVSKENRLYVTR